LQLLYNRQSGKGKGWGLEKFFLGKFCFCERVDEEKNFTFRPNKRKVQISRKNPHFLYPDSSYKVF